MLVNHHTPDALHRAPMQQVEMDNSVMLCTGCKVPKVATSGGRMNSSATVPPALVSYRPLGRQVDLRIVVLLRNTPGLPYVRVVWAPGVRGSVKAKHKGPKLLHARPGLKVVAPTSRRGESARGVLLSTVG